MTKGTWIIAGQDLREEVEALLQVVSTADPGYIGELRNLEEADNAKDKHFWAFAVLSLLMNPQLIAEVVGEKTLLLYAVINTYGSDHDDAWDGIDGYLRRAFALVHDIGEAEVAKRLRQRVERALSRNEDAQLMDWVHRTAGDSPAQMAQRDQRNAKLWQRDLRAADLLDPGGKMDLLPDL